MPIINLIQEQRIAEAKRDQGVRIALVGLVATVTLGVLSYGVLIYQRQALLAEQSRLEQEIALNKPIEAQIDAVTTAESQLKPKLQTLVEARKVSDKWADILTRLQTQTPADTWLTGLQSPQVTDDKPIEVVVTGTARSQEPISEFVLRAQNQPYLDSVQLHFTQEKRSAVGQKAIDWEVGAEILDSAEQNKTLEEQKS